MPDETIYKKHFEIQSKWKEITFQRQIGNIFWVDTIHFKTQAASNSRRLEDPDLLVTAIKQVYETIKKHTKLKIDSTARFAVLQRKCFDACDKISGQEYFGSDRYSLWEWRHETFLTERVSSSIFECYK